MPAKPRPPPKRHPTLRERAEAREQAFLDAHAAHEANPTPETEEALERARASRAAHTTERQLETKERRMLDLLVQHTTADAIAAFADEEKITPRKAREWASKALADRRLSITMYRDVAVHRLEGIAAGAVSVGDFNAAGRAASQAAKFAGVSERVDVNHRVTGEVDLNVTVSEIFAPLADHPKLLGSMAFLDGLPMEPEVTRLIEQKERYERAFDAARVAFHASLREEAPTRVVLQLPAASPPPPSKSERQAALVAGFDQRLAELRERHAAAPNPSTEGELDRLWRDHQRALEALHHEPTTEGPNL